MNKYELILFACIVAFWASAFGVVVVTRKMLQPKKALIEDEPPLAPEHQGSPDAAEYYHSQHPFF